MSNLKVYTNDGGASGVAKVPGTKLFVGDEQMERVANMELVGQPGGLWLLKIEVYVDPNTLFALLPKEA